jgi:hypothetical protein
VKAEGIGGEREGDFTDNFNTIEKSIKWSSSCLWGFPFILLPLISTSSFVIHKMIVKEFPLNQGFNSVPQYLIDGIWNKFVSNKPNQSVHDKEKNRCVCHTVTLPFTLKSILRQKKNYGNSNISLCKNKGFKKSSKRNQDASRYYNSVTNLKFQHKPKYQLSIILI